MPVTKDSDAPEAAALNGRHGAERNRRGYTTPRKQLSELKNKRIENLELQRWDAVMQIEVLDEQMRVLETLPEADRPDSDSVDGVKNELLRQRLLERSLQNSIERLRRLEVP